MVEGQKTLDTILDATLDTTPDASSIPAITR